MLFYSGLQPNVADFNQVDLFVLGMRTDI